MHKVVIPRENVSDNEYKIIAIPKKTNEYINKNELIGEIESSKAILELHAEEAGYFFTDRKEGDMIGVGEVFAFINSEEFDAKQSYTTFTIQQEQSTTGDLVFTKKAGELINQYGIDINDLISHSENKQVISERDVLKYQETNFTELENDELAARFISYPSRRLKRIAIVGGGASAVQVIDLMMSMDEYLPACIFDDTPHKLHKKLLGVPIIDRIDFDAISRYHKESVFDEVIITIPTSIAFRCKVFNELKKRDLPFANLVHKTVHVGLNVRFGEGNIILPQCHIGACTSIGNNNYVTAKCSIEHNNVLGDHCTFGPGVMASGTVTIGNRVKFGAGIFIEPYVKIGDDSVISSGSIITKSVEANTTVIFNKHLKYKQ